MVIRLDRPGHKFCNVVCCLLSREFFDLPPDPKWYAYEIQLRLSWVEREFLSVRQAEWNLILWVCLSEAGRKKWSDHGWGEKFIKKVWLENIKGTRLEGCTLWNTLIFQRCSLRSIMGGDVIRGFVDNHCPLLLEGNSTFNSGVKDNSGIRGHCGCLCEHWGFRNVG
jgi:hypothetical protein